MRRFRDHIVFILITSIVALVTTSYYRFVLSDPVQRNAPERNGPVVTGGPVDFQLSLQTPFSPYQHEVRDLNHFLLALNLLVCGIVGILALYVVWRYRRSRNSSSFRGNAQYAYRGSLDYSSRRYTRPHLRALLPAASCL